MAKTRELKIAIVGDSAQLSRAFVKAGKDVDHFGKKTDAMGKKFSAGMKVAGAAAAGALAVGLKESVKAAVEAEKVQARLEAQLKASGTSYKEHATAIEASIKATSRLSGLDDEDLASSFTNIVRVTGDVNEALRLNALAADIARGKNIDVAKAGELVAKAAGGNVGALRRYIPTIKEGATAQEALAQAQATFAGQAEKYGNTTAGAADRAKVGFESLQEAVGERLAPVLAKVANKFADLIDWLDRNEGTAKALAITTGVLVTAIGGLLVAARIANAVMALRKAMLLMNTAFLTNPVVLITAGLVALGVALVTAYRKSETFRNVVDGVFSFVKKAATAAIGAVIRILDGLMGAWSTMLGALGKVPGFGWAKRAAQSIDNAREKLRGLASALDDVPRIKDIKVNVSARISPSLRNLLDDENSISPRPPAGSSLTRQRGGIIPGTGRGDRVPLLAEPGEFVMQRKVVEKFGPTFFAAINDGQAPQRFTSGGIVSRANKMDSMHLPYLWGGGHGGGIKSGVDCSGAVSWALGVSPRVSGAFTSYGKPGAGSPNDTKVYANAEHVFAVFNGRGWGTSRENPGGGPGWLSYNHRPGFVIRHLEDGAAKTAAKRGDPPERAERGKTVKAPASQTTPGRFGGVTAPAQPSYDQDLADADVAVAEAQAADVARQVAAQQQRRGVVRTRLDKVTAALKKKTLRKETRLRLTQERGQLLGELHGIDSTVNDLQAGAAANAANAVNDALIEAIEANTAAQEAAREAAEAAAEAERQRMAELNALRLAIEAQIAFADRVSAVTGMEAVRALSDVISGQMGVQMAARRALPGSGALSRL